MTPAPRRAGIAGAMLFAALLAGSRPARADMGPRFAEPRIVVHVTEHGKPSSQPVQAVLLEYQAPREKGQEPGPIRSDRFPWMKEIDPSQLADPDGGRWAPVKWGEYAEGSGGFTFRRLPYGIPQRVRLALYLPNEKHLFVTNEAPTQPYLTSLAADLSPDGEASLRAITSAPVVLVLGVLAENVGGLLVALLLTLLLEAPVVLVCAAIARRRDRLPRLMAAAVLGNVITLPLVWFVSVYGKIGGPAESWLPVFLCAEVAAACFEGWLYARLAGLRLGTALGWSALANGVSLLVGCGLVGFTV